MFQAAASAEETGLYVLESRAKRELLKRVRARKVATWADSLGNTSPATNALQVAKRTTSLQTRGKKIESEETEEIRKVVNCIPHHLPFPYSTEPWLYT